MNDAPPLEGRRKWILSVGGIAVGTGLLSFGLIGEGTWLTLTLAALGGYGVVNVVDKHLGGAG